MYEEFSYKEKTVSMIPNQIHTVECHFIDNSRRKDLG